MTAALKALLVPLDGSRAAQRAIGPAVRLAQHTGTPVTLFHWNFDGREAARVGRQLDRSAVTLDAAADVEVAVNEDLPGSIAAAAERRSATICMATKGRHGLARAVMGSVAEAVLQQAAGPLMLIGPRIEASPHEAPGRVLLALDGSQRSERALPTALAWSAQLHAPLELVHVLEPVVVDAVRYESAELVDAGYLARVAERFDPQPAFEVLHGEVASSIIQYADDAVEVVVVASHGRTGLPRAVLGSVSMAVAHRSPRPVLVVPTC